MPSDHFAVNGIVMPAADARVSVLDLGFLRGVGAFETMPTYAGGYPHAVGEHLRRIWESAATFGLKPFFNEADFRRTVRDIYRRSGHPELRINLVVTPGENLSGVFGGGVPTWVIIARDIHAPPREAYESGVSAITFDATRYLPTFKTTNYLTGATGMAKAQAAGAHEAFYVDASGYVTEGVTSNVLIVKGRRVMTPAADCLPGITKAGIRPLAEAQGLAWWECRLTRDDVYTADEVWITSAVRELLPVVSVDGHAIADGSPGPWAKKLRALYRASCERSAREDARLFPE
jgi:branched-subunit amino acid aminotransferase/4-amino-4-deoxychorismate lyase